MANVIVLCELFTVLSVSSAFVLEDIDDDNNSAGPTLNNHYEDLTGNLPSLRQFDESSLETKPWYNEKSTVDKIVKVQWTPKCKKDEQCLMSVCDVVVKYNDFSDCLLIATGCKCPSNTRCKPDPNSDTKGIIPFKCQQLDKIDENHASW